MFRIKKMIGGGGGGVGDHDVGSTSWCLSAIGPTLVNVIAKYFLRFHILK